MSHETRWPSRHPLCTCPELTFANLATFDRTRCAGGATAHPVLTGEEGEQLVAALKAQHGVKP